MLIPDPASKSGEGIRTIGIAESTGRIVTVLTLTREGTTYRVNGWPASDTDIAKYLMREADE